MLSLCDSSHKARAPSVRLHLGEVGLCVVAISAELGLDAEHDPAAVDQLLDLRCPAFIDVTAGVLRNLAVVDVLVHEDAGLDAGFGVFGTPERFLNHFMCGEHLDISCVVPKNGRGCLGKIIH